MHGRCTLLLLLLVRQGWRLLVLMEQLLLLLVLLMAPKCSVQCQHTLLHGVQLNLHRPQQLTLPADLLAAQAPDTF